MIWVMSHCRAEPDRDLHGFSGSVSPQNPARLCNAQSIPVSAVAPVHKTVPEKPRSAPKGETSLQNKNHGKADTCRGFLQYCGQSLFGNENPDPTVPFSGAFWVIFRRWRRIPPVRRSFYRNADNLPAENHPRRRRKGNRRRAIGRDGRK